MTFLVLLLHLCLYLLPKLLLLRTFHTYLCHEFTAQRVQIFAGQNHMMVGLKPLKNIFYGHKTKSSKEKI